MKAFERKSKEYFKKLIRLNELRSDKKYEEAIKLAEQMISQFGSNANLAYVISNCCFFIGFSHKADACTFLERAVEWILKAIEMDPGNPSFYTELGGYYWLGILEYEKARQAFQKALDFNPQYTRALAGLSSLYGPPESSVTLGEAIKYLEKAVSIEADIAVYHDRLASLYQENGQSSDAEKEMSKALLSKEPLDPGYAEQRVKHLEVKG